MCVIAAVLCFVSLSSNPDLHYVSWSAVVALFDLEMSGGSIKTQPQYTRQRWWQTTAGTIFRIQFTGKMLEIVASWWRTYVGRISRYWPIFMTTLEYTGNLGCWLWVPLPPHCHHTRWCNTQRVPVRTKPWCTTGTPIAPDGAVGINSAAIFNTRKEYLM